ncbi:MAG: hypothetical protein WDO24_03665 [Pseudomonadota bacterium]
MKSAHADRERGMTASLLGIALSLVILIIGVFLGQKLAGALRVDDAACRPCRVASRWRRPGRPRPVERRGGWHDLTGRSQR